MRFAFFVLIFLIGVRVLAQSKVERRVALVIGVKSYQYVAPLQNSLNDAMDIASTLKSKGFQVIELYDPKTKREMQDAVRKYFALIQGQNNSAGLVYYSGHGMQVDGSNYLIPAQADPQIKADLDDQCLNMDYVMQAIEQAGNDLNIFILDACRNNPFRSFSRSTEKGLSMVNTPKGSYIVYATKPGSVASDGTGKNGLFTSKLLKYLNSDGLNIEQVFKRVAADVALESSDAQRPWIASDYTGDFYFTQSIQSKDVAAKSEISTDVTKDKQVTNPIQQSTTSFEMENPNNYFLELRRQEKTPRLAMAAPSPKAIVYSDLGFTEVSIDYSRILRRDRKLFGEGGEYLFPFGKIWRTAANLGTRIYFSKDIMIDHKIIEKGGYTILTWPNKDYWDISLYKDLQIGGNVSAYNQALEVVKIRTQPKQLDNFQNTFNVEVIKESDNSGIISMSLEKTLFQLHFKGISPAPSNSKEVRTIYQRIGASEILITYKNQAPSESQDDIMIGEMQLTDATSFSGKIVDSGSHVIWYNSKTNSIYMGNKSTMAMVSSVYQNSWYENKIHVNVKELNPNNKDAILEFLIGKNYFLIPISVDYERSLNESISLTVNNSPTNGELYSIATYYLEKKQHLDLALDYVRINVKANPAAYWAYLTQAKIEFEMEAFQSALSTATTATEKARIAKNSDYVTMGEKLVEQIKQKL